VRGEGKARGGEENMSGGRGTLVLEKGLDGKAISARNLNGGGRFVVERHQNGHHTGRREEVKKRIGRQGLRRGRQSAGPGSQGKLQRLPKHSLGLGLRGHLGRDDIWGQCEGDHEGKGCSAAALAAALSPYLLRGLSICLACGRAVRASRTRAGRGVCKRSKLARWRLSALDESWAAPAGNLCGLYAPR